jgi:hypothetical protein
MRDPNASSGQNRTAFLFDDPHWGKRCRIIFAAFKSGFSIVANNAAQQIRIPRLAYVKVSLDDEARVLATHRNRARASGDAPLRGAEIV